MSASRLVTVSWVLEGRTVQVEASMLPAEHDVGIMSPYPENVRVLAEDGQVIDVPDATIDKMLENEELGDRLCSAYDSQVSDWPDNVI